MRRKAQILTILLLSLINSCTACVTMKLTTGYHYGTDPKIDSEVAPYLLEFMDEAHKRYVYPDGSDLVIQILPMNQHPIVGKCFYANGIEGPYIMLDQKFWSYSSDTSRKILVFHELGHCLLLRDHSEAFFKPKNLDAGPYRTLDLRNIFHMMKEDEIPDSIMYPYVLDADEFNNNKSHYMDELFYNASQEVKLKLFKNIDLPENLKYPPL